jgi:hypothetical protein
MLEFLGVPISGNFSPLFLGSNDLLGFDKLFSVVDGPHDVIVS